jgi:hypothetical protein
VIWAILLWPAYAVLAVLIAARLPFAGNVEPPRERGVFYRVRA